MNEITFLINLFRLNKSKKMNIQIPEKLVQLNAIVNGQREVSIYSNNIAKKLNFSLSSLHFGDLFSVTEIDVCNYLIENPKSTRAINFISINCPIPVEDSMNIAKIDEGWEVYYLERGEKQPIGSYIDYNKAIRFIAKCLFAEAILISADYSNKYFPDSPIPRSGIPWPDGKIRY